MGLNGKDLVFQTSNPVVSCFKSGLVLQQCWSSTSTDSQLQLGPELPWIIRGQLGSLVVPAIFGLREYQRRPGSKCHAQKVGVTHLQTQQLQSKPIESRFSNLKSRKHNIARRVFSCHPSTFDSVQYNNLNYGVQADFR